MTAFLGQDYTHGARPATGVLLTNLGTPDAPTAAALRRYLGEFLWDPRVVEFPRALWWLALHGIILRVRPRRSAHAYQQVWTDEGSPLLVISRQQRDALQARLGEMYKGPVQVELGMRYGNPSIASALRRLRDAQVQRLVVLPLYPQYSATTTASTFDAVADELKRWRWLPELRFINTYHDHTLYIEALASSIRAQWARTGRPQKLLFSFHGMPRRYLLAGDPYYCYCQKTARRVAETLGLSDAEWLVVFQSRFGREEWLKPYISETLQQLAGEGVRRVDVICPGFSADCLETLEEIAKENHQIFLGAGGQQFHYIPALNDCPEHIELLAHLVDLHAQGWPETNPEWSAAQVAEGAAQGRRRALALGAPR